MAARKGAVVGGATDHRMAVLLARIADAGERGFLPLHRYERRGMKFLLRRGWAREEGGRLYLTTDGESARKHDDTRRLIEDVDKGFGAWAADHREREGIP